jgi:hypothetical protein
LKLYPQQLLPLSRFPSNSIRSSAFL